MPKKKNTEGEKQSNPKNKKEQNQPTWKGYENEKYTIKMSLDKFIQNKTVKDEIEKRVDMASQDAVRLSYAVNLFFNTLSDTTDWTICRIPPNMLHTDTFFTSLMNTDRNYDKLNSKVRCYSSFEDECYQTKKNRKKEEENIEKCKNKLDNEDFQDKSKKEELEKSLNNSKKNYEKYQEKYEKLHFFLQSKSDTMNSYRGFSMQPIISNFIYWYGCYLPNIIRNNDNTWCSYNFNVKTQLAKSYKTNFKNELKQTFTSRQRLYINEWCEQNNYDTDTATYIQFCINGWKIPNDVKDYTLDYTVKKKIQHDRLVLYGDRTLDVHIDYDRNVIDRYSERFVWYLVMALQYIHETNRYKSDEQKKKVFNIAPMHRKGPLHIDIDTNVFYGILCDTGFINMHLQDFRKIQYEHWSSHFDLNKVLPRTQETIEKRGISFGTHIKTDGYSVSVSMNRKRPKKETNDIIDNTDIDITNTRIVSNDPGRANIACMIEEDNSGKYHQYTLTRKQYYHDSGVTRNKKKSEKWQKHLKDCRDKLSKFHSKVLHFNDFIDHLEVYMENYDRIWNEYLQTKWKRLRLCNYAGKNKVVDNFLQSLKDKKDTRPLVIGYGSASFQSNGKGEMSVPTTAMFKRTKRMYDTRLVDEFRTTKLDHKTHNILYDVFERDKNNQPQSLRCLKWLPTVFKHNGEIGSRGRFVNRDRNAAKNILEEFKRTIRKEETPEMFKRTTDLKNPNITDGKEIKRTPPQKKERTKHHNNGKGSFQIYSYS